MNNFIYCKQNLDEVEQEFKKNILSGDLDKNDIEAKLSSFRRKQKELIENTDNQRFLKQQRLLEKMSQRKAEKEVFC